MVIRRRMWESSVIIAYLSGANSVKPDCDLIIAEAKQGKLEIVVSTLAEAEVAYLKGLLPEESEARIQEFFSRSYVIPIAFDRPCAAIARRIIRASHLRGADAVHLAACEQWKIPLLETTDPDLIKLDGKIGNPPIAIRFPRHEGARPMF